MIRLRKLEEKDIPFMLEWMHDPEVNCYFQFDGNTIDEKRVRDFISNSFNEKNRHYAAADFETDEYLGTFSLENIDLENKHAMVAAAFRKCTHGTDCTHLAFQEIMRIGFEELGLEKIYANTLESNSRCCRYVEKNGFHFDGRFRKHLLIRGEWHDWMWYSLLKEEYEALKKEK